MDKRKYKRRANILYRLRKKNIDVIHGIGQYSTRLDLITKRYYRFGSFWLSIILLYNLK